MWNDRSKRIRFRKKKKRSHIYKWNKKSSYRISGPSYICVCSHFDSFIRRMNLTLFPRNGSSVLFHFLPWIDQWLGFVPSCLVQRKERPFLFSVYVVCSLSVYLSNFLKWEFDAEYGRLLGFLSILKPHPAEWFPCVRIYSCICVSSSWMTNVWLGFPRWYENNSTAY